jgi:hypothetical protein
MLLSEGCAQPVAAEDQVRLIRCDGRIVGIQNIDAAE